jgi:hypothetical protein
VVVHTEDTNEDHGGTTVSPTVVPRNERTAKHLLVKQQLDKEKVDHTATSLTMNPAATKKRARTLTTVDIPEDSGQHNKKPHGVSTHVSSLVGQKKDNVQHDEGIEVVIECVLKDDPTVVVTKGLGPALRQAYAQPVNLKRKLVLPTFLQSTSLIHVQQSDQWTCGYRNLQMLWTALQVLSSASSPASSSSSSSYSSVSSKTTALVELHIPSQKVLEQALEYAWQSGYDVEGCRHYQGRVQGKRKWIGAVEVWSVLVSLSPLSPLSRYCHNGWGSGPGMDACVVQFLKKNNAVRLLGPFCATYFAYAMTNATTAGTGNGIPPPPPSSISSRDIARRVLMDCVWEQSSTICTTMSLVPQYNAFPLYLQWHGHSVTVVGVEYCSSTRNQHDDNNRIAPTGQHTHHYCYPTHLLVFDPSKSGTALRRDLLLQNNNSDGGGDYTRARLSLSQLQSKDCQLVLVSDRIPSSMDLAIWKHTINCVTATSIAGTGGFVP